MELTQAARDSSSPHTASQSGRRRGALAVVGVVAPAVSFCIVANTALLCAIPVVGFFGWVRLAYGFNTLVLPALLGVVAAVLLWRRRRHRRRGLAAGAALCAAAALGLGGLRLYATHIEPQRLQLREASFRSTKVSRPLRILHVSDIQSARVGAYERRVFDEIRAQAPDLVLFTGDLLHPVAPATFESERPQIEELLAGVEAPLGVYGVYGDTDGFFFRAGGGTGGLRWLRNQGGVVRRGTDRIALFGLGRHAAHDHRTVEPTLSAWLRARRPEELSIVLGHAPDFVLAAADTGTADLYLAGHTHGGQIRLPLLGPVVTLSSVPRAWARGFRRVDGAWLNVSAGVGAEHAAGLPSIRFNCPPEMTVITVEPASTP